MRIEINTKHKKIIEDLKIYYNQNTVAGCLNRLFEDIERKNLIVQNNLIKARIREIERLNDISKCLIKEMEKTLKDTAHH